MISKNREPAETFGHFVNFMTKLTLFYAEIDKTKNTAHKHFRTLPGVNQCKGQLGENGSFLFIRNLKGDNRKKIK